MATLTIRNVAPETVQRIKDRAKRNGRSMEQELRATLDRSYASRREVLEEIMANPVKNPPTAKEVMQWVKKARKGRL